MGVHCACCAGLSLFGYRWSWDDFRESDVTDNTIYAHTEGYALFSGDCLRRSHFTRNAYEQALPSLSLVKLKSIKKFISSHLPWRGVIAYPLPLIIFRGGRKAAGGGRTWYSCSLTFPVSLLKVSMSGQVTRSDRDLTSKNIQSDRIKNMYYLLIWEALRIIWSPRTRIWGSGIFYTDDLGSSKGHNLDIVIPWTHFETRVS